MATQAVLVDRNNPNISVPATQQPTALADEANCSGTSSSRKAKWWYATFHNVTAVVGAGVLGLPYAMSQLGWIAGSFALVISWVVTLYTMWILIQLHEIDPGTRFDRYPELGQYAFGRKIGRGIFLPTQLVVQVASDIVYMVTGGKSLKKSGELLDSRFLKIRETYFIAFFAGLQLILSQIPNFNSLKLISIMAAVMSLGYSVVSAVTSIKKVVDHHGPPMDYGPRSHKTLEQIFGIFSSFGTFAFAYAGHSVALEIQATLPSTPENPSKKPMWRGIMAAYAVVALCYFSVAFAGYWAFGNQVEDDILVSLEKPSWLVCAANFMVFMHVLGSYQVFAMPVFDVLETFLVRKFRVAPGLPLRLVGRSIYVVITGLIGMCFPFFGGLLGFFGGLVYSSLSYYLPGALWLVIRKPKIGSFHWFASYVAIAIGLAVTILAPIGGMHNIIISAKNYKFFS